MIDERDIRTAIAAGLTAAGFRVVSPEVKEGFKKPAVFADVYPYEFSRLCGGMVHETMGIRVSYFPQNETEAECSEALGKMRRLFLKPIAVKDRSLTVENWAAENEIAYAECSFNLDFEQLYEDDGEDFEEMNELKIGGNV